MKKLISVIAFMLAGIFVFGSCNVPDTETAENTSTTDITEKQTENTAKDITEEMFEFEKLSVAGNDISEYSIVYAKHTYDTAFNIVGTSHEIKYEYDFDRLSAERLADIIKEKFGVTLTVTVDEETPSTDREILVGKTNRNLHPKDLGTDDYVMYVNGEKLVFCGGEFGTTWHSVDAFENWLKGRAKKKDSNPDFEAKDGGRGSYHLKQVACIGDSITQGSDNDITPEQREYLSYPANMQRILWRDYIVYNYGRGGKTMRNDLSYAYSTSDMYAACFSNTVKYDLAIIMLGTNDSEIDVREDWDGEWTKTDSALFKSSCKKLVNKLVQHSPGVKIALMNCPAYYRVADFTNRSNCFGQQYIVDLQKETAEYLLGEGYDVSLYDMRRFSTEEIGGRYFPDSLHPNDKGYVIMAQGVADYVRYLMEGADNEYVIPLGE
ncbi:MAG: GDSL-type esterase/lipase family protein [Eubacteriales bacterium]